MPSAQTLVTRCERRSWKCVRRCTMDMTSRPDLTSHLSLWLVQQRRSLIESSSLAIGENMHEPRPAVTPIDCYDVEETSWGRLVWMIAGRLGNSATMTVGKSYIYPGSANPRHYHPNCDEVLHVLAGDIEH